MTLTQERGNEKIGNNIMAFSDYKNIEQVQKKFQITYHEGSFIQAQEREPPPLFLEEFTFNQQYLAIYTSEGSRTEAVIFPI